MNLWFRAIKMLIAAWLGGDLEPWDESRVRFRCWPNDIDPYMHMNNGRYLTIMDLGRTDLAMRSGLMKVFRTKGWWPVVAGVTIRYKRSIPFFARFTLRTRLVGWDERGVYMEQLFEHKGQLAARAVMKGSFPTKDGLVPPAKIAEAMGAGTQSPPLPAGVLSWDAWLRGAGEGNHG